MAFNYFTSGSSGSFVITEGESFSINSNNIVGQVTITNQGASQTVSLSGMPYTSTFGDYVGVTSVTFNAVSGGGLLGIDTKGDLNVLVVNLTASRNARTSDSGIVIENTTASNYTYTLTASAITYPVVLMQASTGTITVAAGAGVTFIGATLATAAAGETIMIVPTSVANTYLIKVN